MILESITPDASQDQTRKGVQRRLRVAELFCGLGGCAAALDGRADIVAAVDINRQALDAYQLNYSHPVVLRTIESLPLDVFASWEADLWWMSPPCQPFTRRGLQRDVDDPRSAGLLRVITAIDALRPAAIALENVPGFQGSRAHRQLIQTLDRLGYAIREFLLCPTEFGIPNRRRRFFLLASQRGWLPWPERTRAARPVFSLGEILDRDASSELEVADHWISAYSGAVHIVDEEDGQAITSCFTSAYGKSMVRSGSFLKSNGRYRRFSPAEILRLLGYSPSYQWPQGTSVREAWRLLGNSLSLVTARYVLAGLG